MEFPENTLFYFQKRAFHSFDESTFKNKQFDTKRPRKTDAMGGGVVQRGERLSEIQQNIPQQQTGSWDNSKAKKVGAKEMVVVKREYGS